MKVLLVKAHSYGSAKGIGAPIGLGYIASILEEDGHKVQIKDLMLTKSSNAEVVFNKTLKKMKPDILGITCNSHERFFAFDVARWSKKSEDIKVVMGGPHVTSTAEETLKNVPNVDIIVRHEGELIMREICDKVENGKSIENVDGISFRNKGKIHTTQNKRFISDLDSIPFPARHLLEIKDYDLFLPIPEEPRVTNLITSRGCPFKCNFCSATVMGGNTIRMRSPENSVDEIEQILSSHPFLEGLFIYDDNFLFNKKRVIRICEEIKDRRLDFRWGCYGRVDHIDREVVQKLKSAGCEMISFGMESGSRKILEAMNKKTTPEVATKAIKTVKSEGLFARCSFLLGYPRENIIDIFRTYILMMNTGVSPYEVIMALYPILYPGTILFEELKKSDYLPREFNWEDKFDIRAFKDVPLYIPLHDNSRKFFRLLFSTLFLLNYSLRNRGSGSHIKKAISNLLIRLTSH